VADQICADADEYCDSLWNSLHATLDAPTLKGRRPAAGHLTLSTEARKAKKNRRYLERVAVHGSTNRDRLAACRHATIFRRMSRWPTA